MQSRPVPSCRWGLMVILLALLPACGCRHPLLFSQQSHHRPDPFLNDEIVRQCSSGGQELKTPGQQGPANSKAVGRSEVVSLDDPQEGEEEVGAEGVVEVSAAELDNTVADEIPVDEMPSKEILGDDAPVEEFATTATPGKMRLPITTRTVARPQ